MKTVDEALQHILDSVQALEKEAVELADLAGRALANDVVARRALPPWDNSAMDGYAVRVDDVDSDTMVLPIDDHIPAGDGSARHLRPGVAHRIFTGAPLPSGADAIILQEDTIRENDTVRILERPRVNQHIRRAGSDVSVGQTILKAGRTITPGDVSFLASQGLTRADVVRKAHVRVMSSGNELVKPSDAPLEAGQIIDGNTVALLNAVRCMGALPTQAQSLPDDFDTTCDAISQACQGTDVLITTGGVSVGEHDHVREAIKALSGDGFGFWKVAIKPGKPIVFAQIESCWVFGLPETQSVHS